jgi:hypothetical protein
MSIVSSSDYYTPEGNWFGSYLGNGTWNGLVGMIMRNDVHVINVDMTWTADRQNVVDFVTQMYQVRYSSINYTKSRASGAGNVSGRR